MPSIILRFLSKSAAHFCVYCCNSSVSTTIRIFSLLLQIRQSQFDQFLIKSILLPRYDNKSFKFSKQRRRQVSSRLEISTVSSKTILLRAKVMGLKTALSSCRDISQPLPVRLSLLLDNNTICLNITASEFRKELSKSMQLFCSAATSESLISSSQMSDISGLSYDTATTNYRQVLLEATNSNPICSTMIRNSCTCMPSSCSILRQPCFFTQASATSSLLFILATAITSSSCPWKLLLRLCQKVGLRSCLTCHSRQWQSNQNSQFSKPNSTLAKFLQICQLLNTVTLVERDSLLCRPWMKGEDLEMWKLQAWLKGEWRQEPSQSSERVMNSWRFYYWMGSQLSRQLEKNQEGFYQGSTQGSAGDYRISDTRLIYKLSKKNRSSGFLLLGQHLDSFLLLQVSLGDEILLRLNTYQLALQSLLSDMTLLSQMLLVRYSSGAPPPRADSVRMLLNGTNQAKEGTLTFMLKKPNCDCVCVKAPMNSSGFVLATTSPRLSRLLPFFVYFDPVSLSSLFLACFASAVTVLRSNARNSYSPLPLNPSLPLESPPPPCVCSSPNAGMLINRAWVGYSQEVPTRLSMEQCSSKFENAYWQM